MDKVNHSDGDGKIHLITVWPPSDRMSRWVFAVSGKNPFGIWVCRKSYNRDNRNFGIGSDSLDIRVGC